MKRYLPFIIVVAVALITLGSGFALYRSKKLPAPTAASGVAMSNELLFTNIILSRENRFLIGL